MSDATQPAVDPDLLAVLRCPLTLSELQLQGDALVAHQGGLRYPIREGIPQMIVEEAKLPDGVATLSELCDRLEAEGVTVRRR
jgi:uncharacterized protein YbaR (Trm112 family)